MTEREIISAMEFIDEKYIEESEKDAESTVA